MIIATWNVRVPVKPNKQTAVKFFCDSNNMDVLCILESRFTLLTFMHFFNKFF